MSNRLQKPFDRKNDLLTPAETIELETIGKLANFLGYINTTIGIAETPQES